MTKKYTLKKNDFGFYQVSPVPSKEEITKFYAEEFYTGEYKNFNDSSLEVQIKDPDFFQVEVDFGDSQQQFHIGKGSIAIPGNLMGLIQIQLDYGVLTLKDTLSPAIEYANQGITINKYQSDIINLVKPILFFDKSGKKLYAKKGSILKNGDLFKNPQFADLR